MINLKVRGIDLDLSSNAVIALTKQVADIGQFQNRLSSFTNKFTLPLTTNNRTLLGIEDIESNSDIPYSLTDCSLWYNGIEVASNSRLVVDEFSDDAKVSLRPGNAGFFDIIKTLKLRDFDLSEFDHLWNRANIVSYKDHDFTDGISYPLINAGNQSEQYGIARTKGLIPGMFVKYLMNRVADFYGYEINYPTDSLMNELFLLITTQQVGQRISNDVKWVTEKATQTFVQTESIQLFYLDFDPNWTDKWSQYYLQGSVPLIRIPFRGLYIIKISFDITMAATADCELRLYSFNEQSDPIFSGAVSSSGSYEFIFEFSSEVYSEATLSSLSYVDVLLELNITDFTDLLGATMTNLVFECIDNDLPETNYNRPISIQDNLPDITFGQLFVEFGNLTGSYYSVDDIAQVINVIKLNELADNKINPFLYQDKIDVSIPTLKKFAIAGYGKTTILKYADESINNFSININNEQIPDTAILIKSTFKSINNLLWAQDLTTLFIPLWDVEAARIKMDGVNRICRVALNSVKIMLYWESTSVQGTVSFYNIATFEGLNWETLYNERFDRVLGGLIDKMQYLEIHFKIDEIDLINFDFAKPIYLEKPNGYYFVRSIVEFTGSQDSTKFILNRI